MGDLFCIIRKKMCMYIVLTVHSFGRQLSLKAVLPVMWSAFCSMRTQESAAVSRPTREITAKGLLYPQALVLQ